MSSYQPVLFDADENTDGRIEPDSLAFKDFGTGSTAGQDGRLSPQLFGPDESMGRQLNASTSSSYLSLEYYSKWFDVDTKLVLERALRTMYPMEDYVDVVLNGTPDLYGPFWLPTTLIFALFLSSSLSASISAYLSDQPYAYDFTRLGAAVSTVYIYALLVPVGLWAMMRYWAGVEGRTAVDLISIYGYGMVVWIPVALLCIPPFTIVRFIFSAAAFALSGFFLLRNIYPVLAGAPSKAARILVIAVAALHFALAVFLWFGFLNVGKAIRQIEGDGQPVLDDGQLEGDI